MHKAMSVYGFRPLTTDLVLLAAMLDTQPDDLGVRYVPFAGMDRRSPRTVVKLPAMQGIVEWLENTALGTDMWLAASKWTKTYQDCEIRFTMDCGCGLVPTSAFIRGTWNTWLERFNLSRSAAYGRTNVAWPQEMKPYFLKYTDFTSTQFEMWLRMRSALRSLPAVSENELLRAA